MQNFYLKLVIVVAYDCFDLSFLETLNDKNPRVWSNKSE